jgi:uncharacterized membrane protein
MRARVPDVAGNLTTAPTDHGDPVPTQDVEPAPVARRRVRNRWLVHLWLIVTFVAAPLAWLFTHHNVTIHIALALAFFGLVVVHLAQRRRTTVRLAAQFAHLRSWFKPRGRLAFSDLILLLLTLNVMVSGTVDWLVGYNTAFPLRTLTGLPVDYIGWHTLSTVVLIVYLVVHIVRRRKHFRISHIR